MTAAAERTRRVRLDVRGAVQGVGFRPFVYRLAADVGVGGWVANDAAGVRIEVEGEAGRVDAFARRLARELPPHAAIHELHATDVAPEGDAAFEIRHSDAAGRPSAVVLPDLATCDECRRELLDHADRRYRYPFTNCTHCGPRYSIVRALPYDRPNTTMAGFAMCPRCRAEYEGPLDRRFHAQPNACPACGPRLALWDHSGAPHPALDAGDELAVAGALLRMGAIVAVKGIGGFHLMVDARSESAVSRLRERKRRPARPLAVMVADVDAARALCVASDDEEAMLRSAEAPIVLLEKREGARVAAAVAPGTRRLGVMLPYAPLHHLLLRAVPFPLVATSGNLSEEPICTDEREAVARLGAVADAFLVHDRPIERHVDDSVAWVVRGAPQLLRRARGYAPLPVRVARELPPLLAVGAHQKSVVAVAAGRQVVPSQHVGDLDTEEALAAFRRVIADLSRLYEVRPVAVAHDLHPAYASTLWALDESAHTGGPLAGLPRVGVQHHHAHLASCLAEHGDPGQALGIVWDGSGWGAVGGVGDGTVWGGECLVGDAASVTRAAHLRPFRLPGGEAAVREPRRVAVALLRELLGDDALERELERAALPPVADLAPGERRVLARLLATGAHAPLTTSAGRLFDGVAALLGLRQRSAFEGEAAMLLEQAADPAERGAYELPLVGTGAGAPRVLDWGPLLAELLADRGRGTPVPTIAARFHGALVGGIVAAARAVGETRVALTGGCFQNRLLTERAAAALAAAGFEVLTHRLVPPNDGGIALGQIMVAAARLAG